MLRKVYVASCWGLLVFCLMSCSRPNVSQAVQETGNPNSSVNHTISYAKFRDINPVKGNVGGTLVLKFSAEGPNQTPPKRQIKLYWARGNQPFGSSLLALRSAKPELEIVLPQSLSIPSDAQSLLVTAFDESTKTESSRVVRFHDFIGNTLVKGPGGNEQSYWFYGIDRPRFSAYREPDDSSRCVFDNGLVSVVDMGNTIDDSLHDGSNNGIKNIVDDQLFPPYSFVCGADPVNEYKQISDEYGVWVYSTLNDAMYYGTFVYDALLNVLGEPPLDEKLRLRVHYGSLSSQYSFWDGAYANFSDAYPFYYSMASLDAIAHEVAHGVLNRISNMDFYEAPLSVDARTTHEAFSEITAMVVKHEFFGQDLKWIHDEGVLGYARHLDKIVTESGAIESIFDYPDAGENFYLRIGMLTYPFYLLSQQWGIIEAYQVYLSSARNCWHAQMNFSEAAHCIKNAAELLGRSSQEVVSAFKSVKIKLFEEGVLSHFHYQIDGSTVAFSDNSVSTTQVEQWYWAFGDGTSATEINPHHNYAEPGVYPVVLKVVDRQGYEDTITKHVVIED